MSEEELTKDEKSLLLFFETCLVDHYGRVYGRRMNSEDMEIAKKMTEKGLIYFSRLPFKTIERQRGNSGILTHFVRFSDKAWELAHKFRKERANRLLVAAKSGNITPPLSEPEKNVPSPFSVG